ncbi:MAG: histidine phosphatase family protein, partial [Rubrivivax sp.]
LQDFYARCVAAATRLANRHPGQGIALVAHGGVLDCLYRAATHMALDAPRTWQLGNASVNRLLHSAEGLSLVGWNDTRHLDTPA